MGADLRLSAAVLDGSRRGFVLTSLYGRDESQIYCKPMQRGESAYLLTDEERQAIHIAAESAPSITLSRQEKGLCKAK